MRPAPTGPHPWRSSTMLLAILLATTASWSLVARIPGAELLAPWQAVLVATFCAAGLWFPMQLPARALGVWLAGLGKRARVLALLLAMAIGGIWLYAVPIGNAPQGHAEVTVEVLHGKSPEAQGREVWLRLERDGTDVPPHELIQNGKWQEKAPFLLAIDPADPTAVHWEGHYTNNLRLVFVSHPWSGRVRVTWNGQQRDIDLYRAIASDSGYALELAGAFPSNYRLAFPDRDARQWVVALCDTAGLGLLSLALFAWLVTRRSDVPSVAGPISNIARESLWLALPLMATSMVMLLVFYPGLMTSDSLDQWRQAGTMGFSDAHPLLYSLLMVLLRAVWDSPAAVALCQSIAFSLACGWLLAQLRHYLQAPARAAWLAAWLLALFPLLPMTAVTLWKDVPYAAAVIALTGWVVAALAAGPSAMIRWRGVIALSLLLFCVMAMRHNGPPVAIAVVLMLVLLSRSSRWRVAAAGGLALVLMLLLKGPLTSALDVERKSVSYILYSHHIAAHLAEGHLPDAAKDRELLHRINPLQNDWAYNCATVNPVVFNPDFDRRHAQANKDELLRILLELAQKRPDIEYRHGLCASGLIWRIKDNSNDPLYLASVGLWAPEGRVVWIERKPGNPVQDSKAPELAEFIGKLVLLPGMEFIFRPAFYMYALIFACGVGALRRQEPRLWLFILVPAVHTAFLALSIVAQDARYQLPLYATALSAIPLLLAASRKTDRPRSTT